MTGRRLRWAQLGYAPYGRSGQPVDMVADDLPEPAQAVVNGRNLTVEPTSASSRRVSFSQPTVHAQRMAAHPTRVGVELPLSMISWFRVGWFGGLGRFGGRGRCGRPGEFSTATWTSRTGKVVTTNAAVG